MGWAIQDITEIASLVFAPVMPAGLAVVIVVFHSNLL